jgi:hypothetical protein
MPLPSSSVNTSRPRMRHGEALEVAAEGVHDDVGQWDRAVGRVCLWWPEEGSASGQQDELLVDARGAAVEVDVFVVESEALALS